jgi:hypothetical protein
MVTGNLRDVMKESISAAAAYVRSRAVAFGIEPPLFDKRDIHDEWQVHGGGFYHMMYHGLLRTKIRTRLKWPITTAISIP